MRCEIKEDASYLLFYMEEFDSEALRVVEEMAANPENWRKPKRDSDPGLEWDGAGEPPF